MHGHIWMADGFVFVCFWNGNENTFVWDFFHVFSPTPPLPSPSPTPNIIKISSHKKTITFLILPYCIGVDVIFPHFFLISKFY